MPDIPYEQQLAEWAKGKIAQGADPDVVHAHVGDLLHAYQAKRTAQPVDAPMTTGDRLTGALSAGYQGLTLGAGNKITAGFRHALSQPSASPMITGIQKLIGVEKPISFHDALDENTQNLTDFREHHPVVAGGLEIAGSVPTIVATDGLGAGAEAGETAKTTKSVARAWRAMKQGAGYGAASGGLSANRPEDILPGVAKGAAIGATVAPVVGSLAGSAARVASNVVPETLGGETARAMTGAPSRSAAGRASAVLSGALEKGGVDPATVDVPTSSPTSMMELGSRNVPVAVRQARNVPTSNAAQTTDRFLNERAAGAGQRIEEGLATGTGHAPTDVQEPVEQLIERRAQEARPLYEKAEAHGQIKNPDTIAQINALRQHPDFQAAWTRGQRLADLESPNPMPGLSPERYAELQAQGLTKYLPASLAPNTITVRQVNAWKKGLDAMIEARSGSANALSRSEARLYRQKLNGILDLVDEEVPAYAKARQSFKGNSELIEAAQAGADHFKPSVSSDYLRRTLPDLSDGEQEAYRANALNAAVQKIRGMAANPDLPEASRNVNIVQRAFGTFDSGQKLRLLFPDEASYQQFLTQAEQESLYPKTQRMLQGQSTTAAQLEEGKVSSGAWRDAAQSAMGSPFAKVRLVTRALSAMGGGKMPVAVADEIGQQSTLTGSELQSLLKRMGTDRMAQTVARQRLAALMRNTTAADRPLLSPP